MDEAVETVETNEPQRRLMHAARCCAVTPPVLHWDEQIEAIVCSKCERIYAPVVLGIDQNDRDATIRALTMCDNVRERTGAVLGIDRHAVRRRIVKHEIDLDDDFVVTYASRGPTANQMATPHENEHVPDENQ